MRHNKSNIERHAESGQTSEQLAKRNLLTRLGIGGVLGGIAFGLLAKTLFPSFAVPLVFCGLVVGVGVVVAIEESLKRRDQAKRAQLLHEQAKEKERRLKAEIKNATLENDANGQDTDT